MAPFEERTPPLGDLDLGALAEDVRERLNAAGVGFRSQDGDLEFHVDPVPRVLGVREWERLAAGLVQRVRALNAFAADAYGRRRIVAEGVVPERVIETSENYEPRVRGHGPPGDLWVGVAGLDVVRDPAGRFRVLEDNVTTPSGFGYAVAAREVLLDRLDSGARPRSLAGVPAMLLGTLRSASPVVGEPAIVVVGDGPENSAHWEHRWAAEALGVPHARPDELELHDGLLLHRGRRVHVVYRRTDEAGLDSPAGRVLEEPVRSGTVGVVNAFGAGVADDKLAHAYVEAMISFYLREVPLLRSVETLDLGRPEQLERALDTVDELVVKPRSGSGGEGVMIAADADSDEIEAARRRIREDPEAYVAQPRVELSHHPTVVDGQLEPRHVDLRPFVFLRAGGAADVLPGGLTRVALGAGELVVNSTQNGGVKDTWVTP